MTAEAVPAEFRETANERLKRTFKSWFWGAMIASTVMHLGLFSFWPDLTAEDFSFENTELEAIELPPEIEIPPPPQQIEALGSSTNSTPGIELRMIRGGAVTRWALGR